MTTNVRSYYVSEPFTLHCDRVLGQNLLWRHVESDGPEVHHLHLVNAGNDEEQSWSCSPSLLQSKMPGISFYPRTSFRSQPSQSEEDGSLILGNDANTEEDGDGECEDDEDDGDDC